MSLFDLSVSSADKTDAVNSLLFAYSAASERFNINLQGNDWFLHYRHTLSSLGWIAESGSDDGLARRDVMARADETSGVVRGGDFQIVPCASDSPETIRLAIGWLNYRCAWQAPGLLGWMKPSSEVALEQNALVLRFSREVYGRYREAVLAGLGESVRRVTAPGNP